MIAAQPATLITWVNSATRQARLIVTSTSPALAVANCAITHSAEFIAHRPTRSPGRNPDASSPAANSSADWASSLHVSRKF
jgi:hypothetical protein